MKILVLNSGSSSQKACLYEIGDALPESAPLPLWEGRIEWNGDTGFQLLGAHRRVLAELRRRNFIPKEAFPYKTPAGSTYDSGDYHAALRKAMDKIGYAELRKEQAEKRKRGELMVATTCPSGGSLDIFIEPRLPRPLLLVFGETPVAETLAKLGGSLGMTLAESTAVMPRLPQVQLNIPLAGKSVPAHAIAEAEEEGAEA